MGLKQTRTFVVCQIKKIIALFVNTSKSADKPNEATSGRATYLKEESSKVRTSHPWLTDFPLKIEKVNIKRR